MAVLRRLSAILVLALWATIMASPASAFHSATVDAPVDRDADHLVGLFSACGRLTAFTAPMVGTPGSLTVAGVVDGADHEFPIAESATVSPLVPPLALAGAWTCLLIGADDAGVVTDVFPGPASSCGVLVMDGGVLVQQPGSIDQTTMTLDGAAAALIAADPNLSALLVAMATLGAAEACLSFGTAGDGSLATIAVDYALTPGSEVPAPIACGPVDGTPIAYRDPASQPYPEGLAVSVDGFSVDAMLVAAPHQAVLSFHLDAGLEVCLTAHVFESTIVEVGVQTDGPQEVCGALEVLGGLVFVDRVVVSQALTGINFAEPMSASIASACWSTIAVARVEGRLVMCGTYETGAASTFTVSGVTFHLETDVDSSNAPAPGGPQAIFLVGPNPFSPFGASNPARLVTATLDGCVAAVPASPPPVLPDTRSEPPAPVRAASTMLLLTTMLALVAGALGVAADQIERR